MKHALGVDFTLIIIIRFVLPFYYLGIQNNYMIVPSMTTEEIFKEMMRDYEIIKRRSHLEGKILHREMWRKGLQHSLCYKTPYRNEWTIIFQMDTMVRYQEDCHKVFHKIYLRSKLYSGKPCAKTNSVYSNFCEQRDSWKKDFFCNQKYPVFATGQILN